MPAVEQVVAVPKISLDRVPQRSASRCPQKAEQLVEVPTEPGYALAVNAVQAIGLRAAVGMAEQIVGGGGLQGFRAGQGAPAADVEQIVEIPVPLGRRGKGGGPQGSLVGQKSTAANVEQIVDLPARGSSRYSPRAADERFQGFFRTFPRSKKSAELTRQSSPSVPASVSSSELSAHQMALAREPDELADEPGDSLGRCSC